jgi:hypothetical protein
MQIVQDNLETLAIRALIFDVLRAFPGKRHRLETLGTMLGTGIASVRAIVSLMVIENQIRSEKLGRVVSYYYPTPEQLAAERLMMEKMRPFKPYKPDSAILRNQARAKAVRDIGPSKF